MFNPLNFFKKKDNFSLDDYSLPSLNDLPPVDDVGNDLKSENSNLSSGSLGDLPSSNSGMDQDSSLNNQSLPVSNNFNSGFDSPNNFSPSPFPAQNSDQFSQPQISSNDNLSLVETKINHIETKITLLEARFQNIESKLDLIYQMISMEVSEDTKKRLNISSMMSSIRNK